MQIVFYKADGTKGFDPTIPVDARTALIDAAKVFTDAFVDPIKINLKVSFGPLGATALGQSNSNYIPGTLAYNGDDGILKKLIDDRTSIDDKTAIDNLPASDTHTFKMTRAEAKALKVIADDDTIDGQMTFSDSFPFDYTHAAVAGKYDFFGVATHEISELMGRNMFAVAGGEFNTYNQVLDLFKTGRPFDGSKAGDFTIDGTTGLLAFNNLTTTTGTVTKPNGDFADWADSVATSDAWRARSGDNTKIDVSDVDLRVMDVIGYDKPAMDIVFAIDTTGSMGPYINNVKANALQIVNTAFGPDNKTDVRFAIVGFKDAAGPNGPGENTAILKFTEQNTFEARKTATINAINSITVGGGGDIPEGDNSALLFALRDQGLSSSKPLPAGKPVEYTFSGNFRPSAQSHKIILFTDAAVKDVNLGGQVADAVNKIGNTTITAGPLAAAGAQVAAAMGMEVVGAEYLNVTDGFASGAFTFAAPSAEFVGDDATPGPDVPGSPFVPFIKAQLFVIQTGSDSSATASLQNLAAITGGTYSTASSGDLSDVILKAINTPVPNGDVHLIGDDFDNILVGGGGDDSIEGRGGNDFLFGGGFNPDGSFKVSGADILDGGAGNDGLWGADGDDVLVGGAGNDALVGGAGDDILNGGEGDDLLFGFDFSLIDGSFVPGSGSDTMSGGAGNDGIWGGDGDDLISGGDGNDVVLAGSGNDVVNGGDGNDYLLGEDGNDTLSGDKGFDYMYGGAGADTFIFGKGDGADWVLDFNAAEGDMFKFLGFGVASFAELTPLLQDKSTPDHPATQIDVLNDETGLFDEVILFGVSPAQLDGHVLFA